MPKKATNRDAELLYIAKRVGENPGASPSSILKELRSQGRGYRKTDFLKDYAGITGKPQTIKASTIKGGIISGIMRRKDVKAMSKDQQQNMKQLARAAVDATADTGDKPYKRLKIVTGPGKTMVVRSEVEESDLDDMEEGEIVQDEAAIATINHENQQLAFSIMDHIYDKLT